MKRKPNVVEVISFFVLISLIVAIPLVVIIMVMAPSEYIAGLPYKRLKTDYVLMLLQCVLGIFAMLLPRFLRQRTNMGQSMIRSAK